MEERERKGERERERKKERKKGMGTQALVEQRRDFWNCACWRAIKDACHTVATVRKLENHRSVYVTMLLNQIWFVCHHTVKGNL